MFKLLTARLTVFTAAIIWVAGWVLMGLVGWDAITWELECTRPGWIVPVLQVWYIATIVIIGAWVALKGFRFVGKWTSKEEE